MGYSRTLIDLKGRRLLRSCATEPFVDPESLALHARWGVVCERLSKMWAVLNDAATASQFAGEHMTSFSLETVKLLEGEAAALECTHDIFEDMMRTVESRKRLVQRLTLLGNRVCTANITACSNELKLLVGLIRAKSLALFEATREIQKQPVQSFRFSTHTMLACIGDDVADAVADSSIKDLFGFSLTANPFLHPECGVVQPSNGKGLLAVALSKADREQLAHVVEWMGAPTPYGHYFANNRASRAMYAAVVALVAGATPHHTEAPRRRSVVRVAPPKSASRVSTETALCAAALCIAAYGTQRPPSIAADRAFMGKRTSLESLPGTPPVHLPQPRLCEADLRTFAMYEQADRLPDRRHSLSESLASNSPGGRPMPATVSSVQDTPLSYAPHGRKESIATSGFGDSTRAPSPCGGSMSSATSVHVRTKGGKPPMPTREPSFDKDINKRDRNAEKEKDKDKEKDKEKEKETQRKVEWAPVKDGGFVDLFSQNKTQVARMMSRPRTAPTMPARDDAAPPPPPESSGTESRNNSEADILPSRTPSQTPAQAALAGTPFQQPLPVPGPARSPPRTPPLEVFPAPKADVVAPKAVVIQEPAPKPETPPTHDPLNALVTGIRGDPSDPEKATRVLRALATCRGEQSPVSALCQAMALEAECSPRVHTALTLLTSCSDTSSV
eukprot:Rhum_TRINITY_DN2224_c0_g1::Rhum_TRINITY_DN2224_c0_g1_i1::g.6398::m.6398